MKRELLLTFLLAQLAQSYKPIGEGFFGWHREVGFKEAQRIKDFERSIGVLSPIVGGTVAHLNAHPYLAGLLVDVIGFTQPSACGGTLLSTSRVLTAAHCWSDGTFQAWRFTVVLGSQFLYHGGVRIQTSSITLHPHYNPRTLHNDIAMLFLPAHVRFSDSIRPIVLPYGPFLNVDFTGFWVKAAGYGKYSDLTHPTTNTMVRNIFLQVITQEQCRAVYGSVVMDSNICTNGFGGVGICQGDSGGPLTFNFLGQDILIGVSSFVAQHGCELGFPSAFAKVSYYRNWISSLM